MRAHGCLFSCLWEDPLCGNIFGVVWANRGNSSELWLFLGVNPRMGPVLISLRVAHQHWNLGFLRPKFQRDPRHLFLVHQILYNILFHELSVLVYETTVICKFYRGGYLPWEPPPGVFPIFFPFFSGLYAVKIHIFIFPCGGAHTVPPTGRHADTPPCKTVPRSLPLTPLTRSPLPAPRS